MVIHTFCQPEASEAVDKQRLTSSSAPLSSRDGESDDMRRYPSDYPYKTISVNPDPRSQVVGRNTPSGYPYTHSSTTPTCEKSGSMRRRLIR